MAADLVSKSEEYLKATSSPHKVPIATLAQWLHALEEV